MLKMKSLVKFIVVLVLTLVLGGANLSCVRVTLGPEGEITGIDIALKLGGQLPTIDSFDSSPSSITPGDTSTLEWNVSGATEITLDQGIGSATPTGSAEVSPTATTTYTLTAINAAGSVTKSVTVTVATAPPAPTPQPSSLPVVNSFTANPTSISAGGSSTLTWSVFGATSVFLDHGGGNVPASGSAIATPSATTTYTLTATNAAGSVTRSVTVTIAAAPPPPASLPVILSFTANPTSINSGESTTLGWNVSGATAIYIDNGIGQIPYTTGYVSVRPSSTITYILTATGPGGTISRSVTVMVIAAPSPSLPVISFFVANPSSISAGGNSTLSWSVTGVTSVTITPGGGSLPASGSAMASPASTTTYTLTATNAAGTVTRSVTVTVAAAPPPPSLPVINSFTANPPSISAGGSSTLSWSVTGVTSVTITPGGGSLPASGSATASPAATTTYTLTATNAAGSVTRSVTITVAAAPPPPPADAAACEQALFNAVNAVRASNGKAALTRNAYIDGLCRQHAQYMATQGVLSHENFNTRFNAIVANIPGMHACAENVLQNNLPCDANAMAQQWFNSPGHKTNMLNAAYTISGMGIVIDGGGKIWACQMFAGP